MITFLLQVEDQDADDVYIYTITGAEGVFTMVDNTITLSGTLDYEVKSSYTISVEAVDGRADPQKVN